MELICPGQVVLARTTLLEGDENPHPKYKRQNTTMINLML